MPYDCLYILPTSTALGGVVVVTSNALIYVDQSSRRVALPLNGWPPRISDLAFLPADPTRHMILEGSRAVFVDDKNFFLILEDGSVYPVEIIADGKTVSKLAISPPLAQTAVPSVIRNLGDDHIFVGSSVGLSVLLKAAHVEEEVEQGDEEMTSAVVKDDDHMDYDEDDEGSIFVLIL